MEELHRGGVAHDVRGDCLLAQRWVGVRGDGDVLVDESFHRVAAEWRASAAGEQGRVGWGVVFVYPCPEDRDGLGGQWSASLFSALAHTAQVWAAAELDVPAPQAGELADA